MAESGTATSVLGNLVVRSLEDVHEPIDPRISLSSRPDAESLDDGFGRQLSDLVHARAHTHRSPSTTTACADEKTNIKEPLYVGFPSLPHLHLYSDTSIRLNLKRVTNGTQSILAVTRNGRSQSWLASPPCLHVCGPSSACRWVLMDSSSVNRPCV